MTAVDVDGLTICYEEAGDRNAPTVLLIMGLGAQLTVWPEEFWRGLVTRGFRVIRYDNRDVGLSDKFDQAGTPDLAAVLGQLAAGETPAVPYRLDDMARDAIGLLDALAIRRAHVVGASMGGMIAQILAADHPDRVLSLTSIMSTSGRRDLPPGRPDVMQALLVRPNDPTDRAAVIAHMVRLVQLIGSPAHPRDEAEIRRRVVEDLDRCYYPPGVARHFAAVLASGSREKLLPRIRVPVLVVHGADDPLIPVAGGEDTAALIPGAALKIVPGMGHDITPTLAAGLVDAIAEHCRRLPVA